MIFSRRTPQALWNDPEPVREDLFSVERLELHAESLAAAQIVTPRPAGVISLQSRLDDNAAVLLKAYRASAAELESGRGVVPAAEWLLDNYHLVEAQNSRDPGRSATRILPAASQTVGRPLRGLSAGLWHRLGVRGPHG